MNLTFRQFYKASIDKTIEEYKCTRKEAVENYPEHYARNDHGRECFKAAQNNIILRRAVLDSLHPLQRYRIFHDLPDYLTLWFETTGKSYIEPDKRKESKQKFYDFRRSAFRKGK